MPRFPTARQRAPQLLERPGALYPEATCSLNWRTPDELLVATMLSAQCTDVRVNIVTPELFARFPDAVAAAAVEPEDVEPDVRSTGFFATRPNRSLAPPVCWRAKPPMWCWPTPLASMRV